MVDCNLCVAVVGNHTVPIRERRRIRFKGFLHADEVSNFVTETENIEVYLGYRFAAEYNLCGNRKHPSKT